MYAHDQLNGLENSNSMLISATTISFHHKGGFEARIRTPLRHDIESSRCSPSQIVIAKKKPSPLAPLCISILSGTDISL